MLIAGMAGGAVSAQGAADSPTEQPAAARAAAEPRLPGEVLVQLRSGDDLAALQSRFRLTLKARFGARPIFRFSAPTRVNLDTLINNLRADPRVVVAEPNFAAGAPEARKLTVWAVGNAGQYAAQWAPQALALAQAHQHARGEGVRVAVLDSGVDAAHPALAGRLLPGRDFVDNDSDPSEVLPQVGLGAYGHGTHVAALVALAAPGATILPLRVLDPSGESNIWVLAEAMLHAVDPDGIPETPDGARVVNMSLGTLVRTQILDLVTRLVECDYVGDDDDDRVPLDDPGYQGDRDRCNVLGSAVVVAAAGNSGSTTEQQFPAAEKAPGTLAVAASNAAGRVAAFSNRGPWIDLAAPGANVTSAVPGGWGTWSGTSMATPLVAGVAALLFGQNPDWKPEDVTKRILENTVPLCGTWLRQLHAEAAVLNEQRAGPACR